jgi:hypothetical protein
MNTGFFRTYARLWLAVALCAVALTGARGAQAVRKDSISVWGEVKDLFSGALLDKGMVTVFDENDSIVLADTMVAASKGKVASWTFDIPGGYKFKLAHGGNYKIRFDIDGYVAELQDLIIPDRQYHKYTTEWKKDFKVRKKPKDHMLGEAVVKATRIKMVVKGDTVEFDADAFNVAEGSMLDKLLERMPGMEIKSNGEIYHNGKKVESLLVDGKDFFSGDPKLALENLPAYTVKKVQVYRRTPRGAAVLTDSIKREEMKQLVIDVRLKKQYQKGWIGTADLAYGTSQRFSTRLALIYFSSVWRFMGWGNINNANQSASPSSDGEFWDGDLANNGVHYNRKGGLQLMYNNEGVMGRASVEGSHTTDFNSTETTSTTYLNSGDTYTRSRNYSRNSSSSVAWDWAIDKEKDNFYISFSPLNGSYTRTRGLNNSRSATFGDDPRDTYRLASLDSLFMPAGSKRLESIRQNTVLNASQSLVKATSLNSSATTYFRSPVFGNDVTLRYYLSYSDNRTENYQHYKLDNRQAQTTDVQNVYCLTPASALSVEGAATYNLALGKNTTLDFNYSYKYTRDKNNPDRYRLDSLAGWDDLDSHQLGTLPSTHDWRLAALDQRNSYHRTTTGSTHSPSIAFRQKLPKEWSTSISLPLNIQQNTITDSRANNGQRKSASLTALSPQINFMKWSNNPETGDVVNYFIYYNHSVSMPSVSYLVDLTDDTNPLFVSRGNTDLKNTHTNTASFHTWFSKQKHVQSYGASLTWTQTGNAVASTTTYDHSTGVTTYRPRNINGNWSMTGGLNYSRTLDKKDRLTFSSNISAAYNHSVDYITETQGGETTPLRSTVHNWTNNGSLTLSYTYKDYTVEALGNAAWRLQNSSRDNFSKLNAVDFSYGLSANGPIVAGIEFNTKLKVFSRRGYTDESMNDNHVVWNLTLSRSFLKSKALVLRLEAHDLLNQISSTENVVNAQGRTETWYNSIPRFAMLHVCYKFNSMSKKKKDEPAE